MDLIIRRAELRGRANLIVVNAETEMDAVRLLPECLWVIRRGRIIAKTTPARSRVELGSRSQEVDFKRRKRR
jgi:cytosine deaminase